MAHAELVEGLLVQGSRKRELHVYPIKTLHEGNF